MMDLEKKEAPAANRGIERRDNGKTSWLEFLLSYRYSNACGAKKQAFDSKMTPFVTRFQVKECTNDSFSC
jgi:hypothetical protein